MAYPNQSSLPLAVLASGSGSNLQSILEACARGEIPAHVAMVVVNVPRAGAIARAKRAGVPVTLIDHRKFDSRQTFEAAVDAELARAGAELVVLAGFMRVLTPWFVGRWKRKIINIHPSLLPAFPGAHAVRDALAAGASRSGCTVHIVDEGVDTGDTIEQRAVDIDDEDTVETLHKKIQAIEHRLLPEVIGRIARHELTLQ